MSCFQGKTVGRVLEVIIFDTFPLNDSSLRYTKSILTDCWRSLINTLINRSLEKTDSCHNTVDYTKRFVACTS